MADSQICEMRVAVVVRVMKWCVAVDFREIYNIRSCKLFFWGGGGVDNNITSTVRLFFFFLIFGLVAATNEQSELGVWGFVRWW